MPHVRVAWYSSREGRRYHICAHCPDSWRIEAENLVVVAEWEVPESMKVYSSCQELVRSGGCAYSVIPVS